MTEFDNYTNFEVLTDFDLHLIRQGTHYKTYEKLGARVMTVNNIKGTHFAVWAPNAINVSVIGTFNNWNGEYHPMKLLGDSGIWELFIPGIGEGELYKYEIITRDREIFEKADPYAFCTEIVPKTASVVYDIEQYQWHDEEWMTKRPTVNTLETPVSIYEVHLGSWMRVPEEGDRFLTYRELAHKLVDYVKEMGYTHIELLPIAEHPFYGSWGYQVMGYFAPTRRYGLPDDFMYFVDYCHNNNIGVILDWVPAHFPSDGHGLVYFDGTCLYEHEDPRQGKHKDWNTLIYNYGRYEVKNFLISNVMFWLEKYHIDGLRVDAVASMLYLDYSRSPGEWVPNIHGGRENLGAVAFIKEFNEIASKNFPGIITIAEESTSWPGVSRPLYVGGLGFNFKWNMGWMHDMLEYMSSDPVFRKFLHTNITFSLWYSFMENYVLPLSHDEVVHLKHSMIEKMPGDLWKQFANLRLLYSYMFAHPGKKLLFMGSDFGQWHEWNHDASLDWHLLNYVPHSGLLEFVKDLNHLYTSEPSLHELDVSSSGFQWIDFKDVEKSVVAFMRKAKNQDDILIFIFNFTPVPRRHYIIGVPYEGFYEEILNSDSYKYWGSNMGNYGGVDAEPIECHGYPYSIDITLPPLGAVVFKPPKQEPKPEIKEEEKTEEPKEVKEELTSDITEGTENVEDKPEVKEEEKKVEQPKKIKKKSKVKKV